MTIGDRIRNTEMSNESKWVNGDKVQKKVRIHFETEQGPKMP